MSEKENSPTHVQRLVNQVRGLETKSAGPRQPRTPWSSAGPRQPEPQHSSPPPKEK